MSWVRPYKPSWRGIMRQSIEAEAALVQHQRTMQVYLDEKRKRAGT